MANNSSGWSLPSAGLALPAPPLRGLRGYPAALALGAAGAVTAVLIIFAPAMIAVFGAVAVLVLSAVESEPFLLGIIFLTPLSCSLGPQGARHDVSTALHILVIVGFFCGRFWRGQVDVRSLLRPSLARASLGVLGGVVVSVILGRAGWTSYSAHSLYTMGSYVGFFFLVLEWADSRERVQKILRVLLYSAIATSAFAILQEIARGYTAFWDYLNPQSDSPMVWDGRATSFLNYPNSLAGYLNLILPVALACYVLGKGSWKKLGGWTLGLAVLALLSTQSIGGVVAFVAVITLAIFCFTRNRKKSLVLLAGTCVLLCLLYLVRNILNPTHSEGIVGFDAVTRFLLWTTAWSYFIHSPLAGVGWGNFIGLYGSDLSSFSDWIQPGVLEVHNLYLQLLAETGLIGFAAFFYLIQKSWRTAWGQLRSSFDFLELVVAFGVLGAVLSVLVHGFVDFLFQVSPQFGTQFWLLLAMLVACMKPGHKRYGGHGKSVRNSTIMGELPLAGYRELKKGFWLR